MQDFYFSDDCSHFISRKACLRCRFGRQGPLSPPGRKERNEIKRSAESIYSCLFLRVPRVSCALLVVPQHALSKKKTQTKDPFPLCVLSKLCALA